MSSSGVQITGHSSPWSWQMLTIFGFISAIFNLWFAHLIWKHKELQAHPMRLFMWIAIADAIYFSNQFFAAQCCNIGIQYPFVWFTRLQNATQENQAHALISLTTSACFIEFFGLYLSLSLNYCLNADLILMIKYPFNDK